MVTSTEEMQLLMKTPTEAEREVGINTLACLLLPEPVFCQYLPLAKHTDKPVSKGCWEMKSLQYRTGKGGG